MTLTCIIVDDEPLALTLLKNYVEQTPFLQLIGAYTNAIEAAGVLTRQAVDLLFSDIQMPDMDGLELAKCLPEHTRVIFTTAFEQYALDSYKTRALGYQKNPFTYADFLKTAQRALEWHTMRREAEKNNKPAISSEDSIFIKSEHKLVRIAFSDITHVEGLKDYVKIHRESAPRPLLSLMSMHSITEALPADSFLRIHRSYIVNMQKVDAVERNVVLIKGKELPISESYKENILNYIKLRTIGK